MIYLILRLHTELTDANSVFKNCSNLQYLNIYNYEGIDIFSDVPKSTIIVVPNRTYLEKYESIKDNPIFECKKFQKTDYKLIKCILDGEYHNITIKVNGTKGENVSILFNEFSFYLIISKLIIMKQILMN